VIGIVIRRKRVEFETLRDQLPPATHDAGALQGAAPFAGAESGKPSRCSPDASTGAAAGQGARPAHRGTRKGWHDGLHGEVVGMFRRLGAAP